MHGPLVDLLLLAKLLIKPSILYLTELKLLLYTLANRTFWNNIQTLINEQCLKCYARILEYILSENDEKCILDVIPIPNILFNKIMKSKP